MLARSPTNYGSPCTRAGSKKKKKKKKGQVGNAGRENDNTWHYGEVTLGLRRGSPLSPSPRETCVLHALLKPVMVKGERYCAEHSGCALKAGAAWQKVLFSAARSGTGEICNSLSRQTARSPSCPRSVRSVTGLSEYRLEYCAHLLGHARHSTLSSDC